MTKPTSFTATYIGGPTAILEIGGLRLMTDPTLDPADSVYHLGSLTVEKTKGPATLTIGTIDIVLLSHDQHFDNLDNGGRLLLQKVARTYTTPAGANRLKGTSIGLAPWQSDTVITPDGTDIKITATPARHGPAGIEKIQGDVTGFVLSIGGKKTPTSTSPAIPYTMKALPKWLNGMTQRMFFFLPERLKPEGHSM